MSHFSSATRRTFRPAFTARPGIVNAAQDRPNKEVPRKQTIIAAIAALLLLAALIPAVVWALMVERNRTATRGLASRPDGPELRIYGGLPNATSYGHPVIVLTNSGYLVGYCEAHRNPAWVGFSVSSITLCDLNRANEGAAKVFQRIYAKPI